MKPRERAGKCARRSHGHCELTHAQPVPAQAPSVAPLAVPVWQFPRLRHHPQLRPLEHAVQLVLDAHGSGARHDPLTHAQFVPAQEPSVAPLAVPEWQPPMLLHQPHESPAVHDAQLVLDAHGSVVRHDVLTHAQFVPEQAPSVAPPAVPPWQLFKLLHQPHAPVEVHPAHPPAAVAHGSVPVVHAPAVHVVVPAHACPHEPQFARSVEVSMHEPPHAVVPRPHEHTPLAQACPTKAHLCPQLPQFSISVCRFAQAIVAPVGQS